MRRDLFGPDGGDRVMPPVDRVQIGRAGVALRSDFASPLRGRRMRSAAFIATIAARVR
jgi:hypothetical protein